MDRESNLRLGLCCTFVGEPIRFRTATARHLSRLSPLDRREHLRRIAGDNSRALAQAVNWCAAHGVGAFRVDDVESHAGPGEAVFAPAGSSHAVHNPGPDPLTLLVFMAPHPRPV